MKLLALVCSLAGVSAWQAAAPLPARAAVTAQARLARTAAQPVMDFTGPKYKMDAEAGEVADVPFEVRFSIGNLVTGSGGILFVYCLGSYLINNGQVCAARKFVRC